MKRVRLAQTAPARVRLEKKPKLTYEELQAQVEDLQFQHEIDQRLLREAGTKLETALFEINTIQQGYRGLVQKAEANEARRVRRMVETEFSREVESLTFQLAEAKAERDKAVKHLGLQARGHYEDGPNHSCPECGCVIRPVPLVNGRAAEIAKPARKAR